jgi:endonuclease/exonuclease/phosphatase family metal-dependent hydrolase
VRVAASVTIGRHAIAGILAGDPAGRGKAWQSISTRPPGRPMLGLRHMRLFAVTVVAASALTACANRAVPKDTSPEWTFPVSPQAQTLPSQLRVVTFNVHRETAAKVIAGVTRDPALQNADLILLEEVHRDESIKEVCSPACALGKQLGYYTVYAPGHAQDTGSDGVAVLSRAPITSARVIELPYFNVHTNSGRRVALAVTVDIDHQPVTVYAVHLDNRLTVRDRRTQMMPVLEHAKAQTTPVIIAGDFNTSPMTWIAHLIPVVTTTQDNCFEKLLREHGFDTPVADSGPTHRYIGMKLDGIYTRGFQTVRFATADAKNISDHLALWATVRLASR